MVGISYGCSGVTGAGFPVIRRLVRSRCSTVVSQVGQQGSPGVGYGFGGTGLNGGSYPICRNPSVAISLRTLVAFTLDSGNERRGAASSTRSSAFCRVSGLGSAKATGWCAPKALAFKGTGRCTLSR